MTFPGGVQKVNEDGSPKKVYKSLEEVSCCIIYLSTDTSVNFYNLSVYLGNERLPKRSSAGGFSSCFGFSEIRFRE